MVNVGGTQKVDFLGTCLVVLGWVCTLKAEAKA